MDNLIKVRASGAFMPQDGPGGENLWAIDLGGNRAVINNTPFFTQGLSLYDKVQTDDDGEIQYVISDGGLKNFRAIVIDDDGETLKKVAKELETYAIAVEGGFGALLAVSVTPNLAKEVIKYFDDNDIAWENGN